MLRKVVIVLNILLFIGVTIGNVFAIFIEGTPCGLALDHYLWLIIVIMTNLVLRYVICTR